MWRAGAADCLCRERMQLLRALSDRRTPAGGSCDFAPIEGRLAAVARGDGETHRGEEGERVLRWVGPKRHSERKKSKNGRVGDLKFQKWTILKWTGDRPRDG